MTYVGGGDTEPVKHWNFQEEHNALRATRSESATEVFNTPLYIGLVLDTSYICT